MARLRPAVLVTLMRAAGALWQRMQVPKRAATAQPAMAAKEPFLVELKAGKTYAWCACGHSKKQPFCDGSHWRAAPGLAPLRFRPQEDQRARLCGCKRTRSPPYCDGSHQRAEGPAAPRPPPPP
ncbi:CDGSH iron-sulfur domain-containing protein 3, mitochondrial [Struthio camelus]|uniref:CDGSH iron-sulfur domain-containing protein 3, mitochondrial n=1 Tax=Struthio camelus TaxID=8801 RepID=UPI003603D75C